MELENICTTCIFVNFNDVIKQLLNVCIACYQDVQNRQNKPYFTAA